METSPADSDTQSPMVGANEVWPLGPIPLNSTARGAPVAETGELPRFASSYCAAHQLPPERFVESMLRQTLCVCARWFGLPLLLLGSRIFAADREFLEQVGRVATMDGYFEAEERFRRRCGRRSFVRGLLRLRVSTRRARRLVAETFAWARRP